MDPRIVIVEDEPDVLDLLRDLLEVSGFVVVGLNRPDLLLEMNIDARPDLFLLDLMLPGMSGIELAEQLRGRGYDGIPMIAMSASRLMLEVASKTELFQDTLEKPFDLAALLESVERYVQVA